MPSKILELRRKVSGSFNNEDSLSYIRTNWSGIDGKPTVYTPAGHTHPIAQVTGLQGALDGKAASSHTHSISQVTGLQTALDNRVIYKGLLGTTDLNTLNNEAAQGIYSQNSNANATLLRNYPTASAGAGLLRVYWTGANSGVIQEYNNYIDGRIYVRGYQGSTWSAWDTIADRDWVTSNTRSNTWVPTWAQVTSKPTWIDANKPEYTTDEVEATLSNQYVSAGDKLTWNGKQNALGFTPENSANKRTSIRTSGANHTAYVSELAVKNYVDANAVPASRTIAGNNLTADISRDNLLGTSSAGYVRRTAFANTYDIRTVANMRSDLSINNVTNESKATMFTSPTFTGTSTAAAINVNGAVGLRASALGSAATQILVVSANPASTTRTVQTRTPAQIKSDIGVPTNILRQVSFSGGTLIVEVV